MAYTIKSATIAWTWAAVALLCALPVCAQTVTNPTRVEFTASVDHAEVTAYEVAWFSGATQVGAVVDLGKPTPGVGGLCVAPISTAPLAFGTYTAKVRAKVGTTAPVYSEWSGASNSFDRVPNAPPNVTVKR